MAIKTYFSDQLNAPTLNGTVGSLIAVLTACLVTGYNQVGVASITRSGSTVTVQTTAAHGFASPRDNYWSADYLGNVATIAGADQPEYNGEWPVKVISATVFSYEIGTATPTSPATGSMICKRAPAGFSVAFSDTNRAVYRSNDSTSRRFYLYVNDTGDGLNSQGARCAWWRGYEVMRGIDDGDNPFPSVINMGNQGQFIRKSSALDSGGRRWTLISDGKAFFFQTHCDMLASWTAYSGWAGGCYFGDYLSIAPDSYAVYINADIMHSAYNSNTNSGVFSIAGNLVTNLTYPGCIARKFNGQVAPAYGVAHIGHGLANQSNCLGRSSTGLSWPDPFSNRIFVSPVKIFESSVLRGTLPLYESPYGEVHTDRELVKNIVGLEGRQFMHLKGSAFNNGNSGGLFIDLTGDEYGKWS